jgi:hypothetical protein
VFLSGKPRARFYPIVVPSTCLWFGNTVPRQWRVWITNPYMGATGMTCKEAYDKLTNMVKKSRMEIHGRAD